MPKTAKTRPARKTSNALTADDLSELIGLIELWQESIAGSKFTWEVRQHAKLERIKGKLRRGF